MAKYSLAFDFGATSIRAIIGGVEDGKFVTREVMRMSHDRVSEEGRSRWEWSKIVSKVVETILAHKDEISSIAVNTWGVDFGVVGSDGELLQMPVSYRDARHNEGYQAALEYLSQEDIFMATGNQLMPINSLFQLLVLQKEGLRTSGAEGSDRIHKLLMLPDLLSYMLTGEYTSELTIASTSQLLDLRTKDYAPKILETYGLDKGIFSKIVYPTTVIGTTKNSRIKELREMDKEIKVVAVASHDTASAVLLTEAYTNRETAFLSCGTWSLIGGLTEDPVISKEVLAKDLTNETGFNGTNMFFKNITGLYILEMLKKQLEAKRGAKIPFSEITEYVEKCPIEDSVNVDEAVFQQNEFDVEEAIDRILGKHFEHDFDYFKLIYKSLALKYQETLSAVSSISGTNFKKLHMIGGGTQSSFLCQLVANITKLEVVAGPMEATAYGNLLAQQLALGEFSDLAQGRQCILESAEFKHYFPK